MEPFKYEAREMYGVWMVITIHPRIESRLICMAIDKEQADRIALVMNECASWSNEAIKGRGLSLVPEIAHWAQTTDAG